MIISDICRIFDDVSKKMLKSASNGANYDFARTFLDNSIMVPSFKPQSNRRILEGRHFCPTPLVEIVCQPTLGVIGLKNQFRIEMNTHTQIQGNSHIAGRRLFKLPTRGYFCINRLH